MHSVLRITDKSMILDHLPENNILFFVHQYLLNGEFNFTSILIEHLVSKLN